MTSFAAYEDYQRGRGSNTAWTWEHQAMTRARCVMGQPDLAARFDGVREAVITAPRDHSALNLGNIALLQRAEAAGLLPAGVGRAAADAYRELRQRQHQARLDEALPQLDRPEAEPLAAPVRQLWGHVLGA